MSFYIRVLLTPATCFMLLILGVYDAPSWISDLLAFATVACIYLREDLNDRDTLLHMSYVFIMMIAGILLSLQVYSGIVLILGLPMIIASMMLRFEIGSKIVLYISRRKHFKQPTATMAKSSPAITKLLLPGANATAVNQVEGVDHAEIS